MLAEGDYTLRVIAEKAQCSTALVTTVKRELEQKGSSTTLAALDVQEEIGGQLLLAIRRTLKALLAPKAKPGDRRALAQALDLEIKNARLLTDQSTANVSSLHRIVQGIEQRRAQGGKA